MDGGLYQTDSDIKTKAFLAELANLSRKHGLAISGDPVLFVMEPEDFHAAYTIDDESKLTLV